MSNRFISRYLLLFTFLLSTGISELYAQVDNSYYLGNQLLQQQKYEEAFQVFRKLHNQNPETFLFLEKATESLISLKRYREAIEMTQKAVEQHYYPGQASIRLGEIYHTQGDTSKAFSIWEQTIDKYRGSYQIYLSLARSMSDRRAFDRAIEIYEQARKRFTGSTLLSTELANTYMQAGQYENAIREYLKLVEKEPDRIDYVQRSLIRYGDEYLHDVAILEIDEFLDELPMRHPSHQSLNQLQLWLLLERNLYQRAIATAKAYEEQSPQATYTLYSLGSKLLSENKYELAEEAYRYYIDNNITTAKYRSMEELARVYREWADYLSVHNLAYAEQRDSLYQQSFDILKQLQSESPFYDRIGEVLIRQAELAIDHLHDVDLAADYLEALRSRQTRSNIAQEYYVEGRIKLYRGDYDRARIAFTRSNKQEQSGELTEKTRYYLALTDFYSGDYEFAKIQLNALERQNTSYFANDAVQLRIWIQKGLNADTTGSLLEPFAKGVELFNRGREQQAVDKLAPIVSGQAYHPMTDEVLLVLSKNITPALTQLTYSAITRYLDRWGQVSALRERLLWEKARIADQVVSNNLNRRRSSVDVPPPPEASSFPGNVSDQVALPTDKQEVQRLYEEILMEFPDGFYASFARERIQELKNPQT